MLPGGGYTTAWLMTKKRAIPSSISHPPMALSAVTLNSCGSASKTFATWPSRSPRRPGCLGVDKVPKRHHLQKPAATADLRALP